MAQIRKIVSHVPNVWLGAVQLQIPWAVKPELATADDCNDRYAFKVLL
eukprot:SAG11_NODE_5232_length_1622_cov_1.035456_2_plen_48_part_00